MDPPHREHPDNVAVQQHGDAHDRPEAGHPLRIRSAVVRVGEHVSDLGSPPVEPDPADERSAVQDDGITGDEFPVLRRHPGAVCQPVPVLKSRQVPFGVLPSLYHYNIRSSEEFGK